MYVLKVLFYAKQFSDLNSLFIRVFCTFLFFSLFKVDCYRIFERFSYLLGMVLKTRNHSTRRKYAESCSVSKCNMTYCMSRTAFPDRNDEKSGRKYAYEIHANLIRNSILYRSSHEFHTQLPSLHIVSIRVT